MAGDKTATIPSDSFPSLWRFICAMFISHETLNVHLVTKDHPQPPVRVSLMIRGAQDVSGGKKTTFDVQGMVATSSNQALARLELPQTATFRGRLDFEKSEASLTFSQGG